MSIEREIMEELSRGVRSRRRRESIARELRSHLDETRRELEAGGMPADEAHLESQARFGDPAQIASEFSRVYRPSRRLQVGLAFGLAGTLILGAFGVSGSLAAANNAHKSPSHSVIVAPPHHAAHR